MRPGDFSQNRSFRDLRRVFRARARATPPLKYSRKMSTRSGDPATVRDTHTNALN